MRKDWMGFLRDAVMVIALAFKRLCLRICGRPA